MRYKNIHDVKDSGFIKQVERALEKTGEVPDNIRISLNIPFEHALTFLKRFENERIFLKDGSKVGKSELIGLLAWAWGAGLDIPGEDPTMLLNKWIPGLARVKRPRPEAAETPGAPSNTKKRRGRPKTQTTLLDGLSGTPGDTPQELDNQ